jgi:iron complex transport system permease protein
MSPAWRSSWSPPQTCFWLAALSLLGLLILPGLGKQPIWPWEVLAHHHTLDAEIFWQLRLPRTLFAFIVGAGLAVSGMTFQALFRNPLATPYTLGVASGGAFAAVLASFFGWTLWIGHYSFPGIFGLGGALGTIALVYSLSRLRRYFSMEMLLMAGVAINYWMASAVVFIQYASDYTNIFRVLRTLMGGFEGISYASFMELLPFMLPGLWILISHVHELNLMAMGDEIAAGRGLDLEKTRKLLFLATALIVGGSVAICGPIGFVEIMAPYICRLMIGANHRFLMPATFCLGGLLLCVCDTLARTLIAPGEIPVGALTALLGGPFFIWLLLRKKDF